VTPRAARGLGSDLSGLLAALAALGLLVAGSSGVLPLGPGDRSALVLAAFLASVALLPGRPLPDPDGEPAPRPWLAGLGQVAFALPLVGWTVGLEASVGVDPRALVLTVCLPGLVMLAALARARAAGGPWFPLLWLGLGLALPLLAGVLRWIVGEVHDGLALAASLSPLDWALGVAAAEGAPEWTTCLAPLALALACAALPARGEERVR